MQLHHIINTLQQQCKKLTLDNMMQIYTISILSSITIIACMQTSVYFGILQHEVMSLTLLDLWQVATRTGFTTKEFPKTEWRHSLIHFSMILWNWIWFPLLIHDTESTKCTKLFLRYMYCIVTQIIPTCFDSQGTKAIPHKTKLATFINS